MKFAIIALLFVFTLPFKLVAKGVLNHFASGSQILEVKAKDQYGLDAYELTYFTVGSFD